MCGGITHQSMEGSLYLRSDRTSLPLSNTNLATIFTIAAVNNFHSLSVANKLLIFSFRRYASVFAEEKIETHATMGERETMSKFEKGLLREMRE